jgi:hypothetical protein
LSKQSINIDTELPSYLWWLAGLLTAILTVAKVWEIGEFVDAEWIQVLYPLICVVIAQAAFIVLGLIVFLIIRIISALR